jgi:hypothetical protein
MCRKAHGAAFSTNAVVSTSNLQIVTGSEFISEYESSANRRRCFCRSCGSKLFIRRLNNPEVTVVTLGSIDGELNVRPVRHVFVGSKAPWYTIADTLPQFKVYPGFEPIEPRL